MPIRAKSFGKPERNRHYPPEIEDRWVIREQLAACNSEIGSVSLGLAAPGLVFTQPIATAIGFAPDRRQPPPSLRDATPDFAVTGH
jgi:hypothetical protein